MPIRVLDTLRMRPVTDTTSSARRMMPSPIQSAESGEERRRVSIPPRSRRDLSRVLRHHPARGQARSRLPPDIADIAVRLIHACGMIDIVDDLAFTPDVAAARARGAWRRRTRSSATAPWSRPASCAPSCRRGTRSSARSTMRACRNWRERSRRRARPPPSSCGASASPAPWSRSAMRRRRSSICWN